MTSWNEVDDAFNEMVKFDNKAIDYLLSAGNTKDKADKMIYKGYYLKYRALYHEAFLKYKFYVHLITNVKTG
jgi:hypothetical protein